MLKQIFTLLLLLNSLLIFGRGEIPEFGKIEKDELLIKTCSFDTSADAYNLFAIGTVNYEFRNGSFVIIYQKRVRIKILSESGLRKTHVIIPLYSNNGDKAIKNISGITYNLDSAYNIVTTKMSQDSIQTRKISNKLVEISFNLPGAKEGSVIEYEYSYVEESVANVDDWYFQDDIPTRFSMYKLTIPDMFKFETVAYTFQDMKHDSYIVSQNVKYRNDQITFTSKEKTFLLQYVPALRKEPYMSSPNDYLERITFTLKTVKYGNGQEITVNSDPGQITKSLLDDPDFGAQLKKKITHTQKLDILLSGVTNKYDKMAAVYNYVQNSMKWNGEESVYISRDVSGDWKKKKWNTAEINFALIILLRDAGLDAYPVLASSNQNGKVIADFPLIHLFNLTVACVIIDGQKYILNAADKFAPPSLVPSYLLNNKGFLVDSKIGGWINFPSDKRTYKNSVYISGWILGDTLSGSVKINSYDYAKINEVRRIKEKEDSLENFYSDSATGLIIDSVRYENLNTDSTGLKQKFDFKMPLISGRGYRAFNLNLFKQFDDTSFASAKRFSNIDFNYKQSYSVEGKIELPSSYQFSKIPEATHISLPDSSMVAVRFFRVTNNIMEFWFTLDMYKTSYDVGLYAAIKDFYKKVNEILNEKIEIRRKSKH